jgi:hypothetical protein
MKHFLGEDAPVRGKDFKPKHPPEEEKNQATRGTMSNSVRKG